MSPAVVLAPRVPVRRLPLHDLLELEPHAHPTQRWDDDDDVDDVDDDDDVDWLPPSGSIACTVNQAVRIKHLFLGDKK